MIEDSELLRRYVADRDEGAFADLVRQHLDLVYSVALRQVGGDVHLARDVSQKVFTALARKAASLASRPSLGGWLYRTTQFTAIDAVRVESRRRTQEKEMSYMHHEAAGSAPVFDAERMSFLLDQAIGELDEDDREAIVLRFLQGRSFGEIGACLRLTENAARMRINRALDKLHGLMARRGITSTSAALAIALETQAAVTAPAGLAAALASAALTGVAGGTTAAGTLTLMTIGKLSLAANVALLGVLAFKPSLAPSGVRNFIVQHTSVFHSAGTAVGAAAPTVSSTSSRVSVPAVAAPSLGHLLNGDDLGTLIANLRAAGFPPTMIGDIVLAELDARREARTRALAELDPTTPFWKPLPLDVTIKWTEAAAHIQREVRKSGRDIYQDELFGDVLPVAQHRQFGDLPRDKLETVQRIEHDYAEMLGDQRTAMGGIVLPEDRAKIALLQREQLADVAKVLTSEEFAEYRIRNSSIINQLKPTLMAFEPNEAEFRAVLQAQHALNDRFSTTGGFAAATSDQRAAAQQEFDVQVKAALGEARYADYLRSSSADFIQLKNIAQQYAISPEATLAAYQLRDRTAQESNRIFDDPTLPLNEKINTLRSLAETTRTQLLATLGPSAGSAYVRVVDFWLSKIEQGGAVTFERDKRVVDNGAGMVVFVGGETLRAIRTLPPAATNLNTPTAKP